MWTASIAHGIRVANSYSVETWLPHQPLSSPFRRVGNSAPSPYLFCFDQRKGEKFSPPRLYDVLLHRTYFLKIGANRRFAACRVSTAGNNNFFPAPIGKGNGHLLASFCVRISIHSHARLPFLRESKRTKIDLSLGGAR